MTSATRNFSLHLIINKRLRNQHSSSKLVVANKMMKIRWIARVHPPTVAIKPTFSNAKAHNSQEYYQRSRWKISVRKRRMRTMIRQRNSKSKVISRLTVIIWCCNSLDPPICQALLQKELALISLRPQNHTSILNLFWPNQASQPVGEALLRVPEDQCTA